MQTYSVRLESEISNSFRCQLAADSLDIDVKKKSIHELNIQADIDSDFSVGLIIGASAGIGLGILIINETSKYVKNKYNYKVMAKFSSTPIAKSMEKQSCWKLKEIKRQIGKTSKGGSMVKDKFRDNIKTYSFEFIG